MATVITVQLVIVMIPNHISLHGNIDFRIVKICDMLQCPNVLVLYFDQPFDVVKIDGRCRNGRPNSA